MIKLNDVKVLRNILGDKYKDSEEEAAAMAMPKYIPKKLNMKFSFPNLPKNFGLSKDEWSWNAKVGKIETYDIPPQKLGRLEVVDIAEPPPKVETVQVDIPQKEESPKKEPFTFTTAGGKSINIPEKFQQQAQDVEELTALSEILGKQKIAQENIAKLHGLLSPGERETGLLAAEEKYIIEERKKAEAEHYGKLAEQRLLEAQIKIAADQEKNIELQKQKRGEIGRIKFEQSPMGRFLKGPLVETAGRVRENIGQNLGGSFVGPFTAPGASKTLDQAIKYKQAYMELLKSRYLRKKPSQTIRTEADVMAIGTATEKKRLLELTRNIERAQSYVASTGFMGGSGAEALLRRTKRMSTPNLRGFTQLGYAGPSMGTASFSPEAFGRLGVSQTMTAMRPDTKWDVLLNRGSGAPMGRTPQLLGQVPEERISFLLGKKPDPFGVGAKVKQVLTPVGERTEDPIQKLRRFL